MIMGVIRILRRGAETEVICHCGLCHTDKSVVVPTSGYNQLARGELIQVALPDVSADDRELMISGTCGTCWKKMFPDEE